VHFVCLYCIINYNREKSQIGGARSAYGEKIGVYMVSVGKPAGKSNLIDPGVDGRDNIKMDIQ
jgi:hypothetical protein